MAQYRLFCAIKDPRFIGLINILEEEVIKNVTQTSADLHRTEFAQR